MELDAGWLHCCERGWHCAGSPASEWVWWLSLSRDGEWIRGFFGSSSDATILHMELLAIYHGLTLAWDMGFRIVECQSDSLHAVDLVLAPPAPRHLYAALLMDIRDLLARAWNVKLVHTLQEGNVCADFLAKYVLSRMRIWCFVKPLTGFA